MSRLSHFLCAIGGFAVGFGIAYFLQLGTLDPQILYAIFGGISIGSMFEGLNMLASYINGKRHRRIEHFKRDIAPTLNDWFKPSQVEEKSETLPPEIAIDSTELSSVEFCEGEIKVQTPQEPKHLDYFNETKKHLEKYPNVINLWTKAVDDAKTFTVEIEKLLQEIERSLRTIFKEAEFTELAEEPQELKPNIKFWICWQTTWALHYFLLGKDTFHISSYYSKDGSELGFKASRNPPCFVSFSRSELQSITDKIKQLAPQFKEEINEINKLKSNVHDNLGNFKKETHELVKYINADKQIKGKCNLCP